MNLTRLPTFGSTSGHKHVPCASQVGSITIYISVRLLLPHQYTQFLEQLHVLNSIVKLMLVISGHMGFQTLARKHSMTTCHFPRHSFAQRYRSIMCPLGSGVSKLWLFFSSGGWKAKRGLAFIVVFLNSYSEGVEGGFPSDFPTMEQI